MKSKEIKQSKQIRTRKQAVAYFQSKRKYYNKSTNTYYCQGDNCGRILTQHQVTDDHIDNDPHNNKPGNHQPLCRSCNTHNSGKSKEQMKKIEKRRRRAFESGLSKTSGISAQITINRAAEEPFRTWVIEQVKTYGSISWIDLVDGGCEYVTQNHVYLNQTTAERYLRKLTSFVGPLISTGVGDSRQVELRNKQIHSKENSSGPS